MDDELLQRWLRGLEESAGAPLRREQGMEFGATHAWWGQRKARPRPHEGIDILFEGVVRPIEDGRIVALFDDFLGRTAVVQCVARPRAWVYSHLALAEHLRLGQLLAAESAVIGRAAPSSRPALC